MKRLLRRIPAVIEGQVIERDERCSVCNEKKGIQVAVVDYWDIKTSRLVKCPKCNHMQLDPMLSETETSKGCFAYHIRETLGESVEAQYKNCVRNFRRGVVFGYSLKRKKISPRVVLELGPGSGYFSTGLQFVFPDVEITIMDIIEEVLEFNAHHHKYHTIQGIPDNYISEYAEKFDLVIARDILEHCADISKVLTNVNGYLMPGGWFHFITPNGHEDVWKHYLTSKLSRSASELLINHVNYFDGKGLNELLIQKGFLPLDYYTYKFKTTLRGKGWKINHSLMSPVSQRLNSGFFISQRDNENQKIEFIKENILDKWYIMNNAKWITYLYSLYQHFSVIRIDPDLNVGHEIYGLYKKPHRF
jgi:2-polyprenyl-3-methyl-5-hydroxy-6-metoxy-1,4-benzoquinol methylase